MPAAGSLLAFPKSRGHRGDQKIFLFVVASPIIGNPTDDGVACRYPLYIFVRTLNASVLRRVYMYEFGVVFADEIIAVDTVGITADNVSVLPFATRCRRPYFVE